MKLRFNDLVIKGNKGYFSNDGCQVLFQLDFSTGEVSGLSKLTESYAEVGHLYCNIEIWKDKLILVPNAAKTIFIYDLETGDKNTILCERGDHAKLQLYSHFNYGDCSYFFDVQDNYIHLLDHSTNMMGIIDVFNQANDNKTYFWNQFYAQNKNVIYLLVNQSSTIVKLDLQTREWNIYENVLVGTDAFYDICSFEDSLWLTTYSGEIIQWNCQQGVNYRYLPQENKDCYPKRLYRLSVISNYIAVLGIYRDGTVMLINPDDYSKSRKAMDGILFGYDKEHEKWIDNFLSIKIRANEIILIYKSGNFYVSKDLSGKKYKTLEVDEKNYISCKNFYRREHHGIMLEDFLEILKR